MSKKYIINNLFQDLDNELEQLEKAIDELSGKRIYEISPFLHTPVMPKVVWKYKTYEQVSLHRVVDLAVNACNSWNIGEPGTSFILTRCIFENCAYLYDVYNQTGKFIEDKNFKACDELIMNLTFGSRVQGVEMPVMPNVLNSIDRLTKIIPPFRNHYDHLCDLTHPNYLGMFNLYCKDLQENYISYISKENGINESSFSIFVISLLAVVKNFNYWFEKLNGLYPKLTKLSNDDLEKGNNRKSFE